MNLRESGLVAFTLLVQTSVGVLLVAAAVQAFVSRGNPHAPGRGFEASLLVAAVMAVLGLAASLVHLGQPTQAWLAVANARTSWLSREIALALAFTAAVAWFAWMARAEAGSATARAAVCTAAIALGIAAVYVMSRVYMVPAQPAWNRALTPVGFFATTLVLGTLVVLVTAGNAETGAALPESAGPLVRVLLVAAIALLAVQLLLLPAHFAAIAVEPAAAIGPASGGHLAAWLAAARAILAVGALVLLGTALRRTPDAIPPAAVSTALALACLSELAGRLLFYASSVRI